MITLVHLVWAPLGGEPLERFVASLRAFEAGAAYETLFVMNGFEGTLPAVPGPVLRLARPVLDLAAYRQAAVVAAGESIFFLNSYAEILADNWLGLLHGALEQASLVGASGSYESARTSAPRPLKPLRLGFPPFPNPHLRTSAFGLRRATLERLRWPAPRTKQAALRLESGRRSLTRQAGEALVVGRDGRRFAWRDWPTSGTFRSSGQENLLVADNRTRQYDDASPARRTELARMAWGT
ncbi:MAG: hypothetical protein NVSMB51_15480 [Solirubrobacteraceae bacterium]